MRAHRPGLLVLAKVPDDPVLRRRVTAIRARSLDAEATSERGDCNTALATEPTLVTEAAATWAPLHAETLYVLGMAQDHAGDNERSILTLREAAAVAEAAHDDAVAADSWIQLALNSTYDDGQPDHGLGVLHVRTPRPPRIAWAARASSRRSSRTRTARS